jgi:hypothetical protein
MHQTDRQSGGCGFESCPGLTGITTPLSSGAGWLNGGASDYDSSFCRLALDFSLRQACSRTESTVVPSLIVPLAASIKDKRRPLSARTSRTPFPRRPPSLAGWLVARQSRTTSYSKTPSWPPLCVLTTARAAGARAPPRPQTPPSRARPPASTVPPGAASWPPAAARPRRPSHRPSRRPPSRHPRRTT